MKSDVNRIVDDDPARNKLDTPAVPGAIRSKTSTATLGRGSIASPLTETARTYYAERTAVSSDGIFTFKYKPIQSVAFVDANGNPVALNLTEPPP